MKTLICKSIWSKARGLMFSRKKVLVFVFAKPRKVSLHMLFVFFPIYVYCLDKNKTILEVKKIYPFTLFISKDEVSYIVESPEQMQFSTIKKLIP